MSENYIINFNLRLMASDLDSQYQNFLKTIKTPVKVKKLQLSRIFEENSEHSENFCEDTHFDEFRYMQTKRKNMHNYVLPLPNTMEGKIRPPKIMFQTIQIQPNKKSSTRRSIISSFRTEIEQTNRKCKSVQSESEDSEEFSYDF